MNFTLDLTQIVVYIVYIVLTAILGYAAKIILPKIDAWLDAKVSNEQRRHIAGLVEEFVKAAQQLYDNNEDKLDYVFYSLKEKGIVVDRSTVESAVYDLKKPFMETVIKTVSNE